MLKLSALTFLENLEIKIEMIGYLEGQVLENNDGVFLLGVGSTGSVVGYRVNVPQGDRYFGYTVGKRCSLHIHTHVREDQLDLFGFATREEKAFFLILLGVNGIGPKAAMKVLSSVDLKLLIRSIIQGDKDFLVKVPGIGKKTAERVVVELSDSLKKKYGDLNLPIGHTVPPVVERHSESLVDAREALISLGYREVDIRAVLERLIEESAGSTNMTLSTEDLVRGALQRL